MQCKDWKLGGQGNVKKSEMKTKGNGKIYICKSSKCKLLHVYLYSKATAISLIPDQDTVTAEEFARHSKH